MQTKTLVIGGGLIVVLAVVAAVNLRPLPGVSDGVAVDPVEFEASEATVVPEAPLPAEDAAVAEPVEPVEDIEQVAAPILPVVTDRRFERDGGWLLSGTAAPNSELAILVDGVEVERALVDAGGTFLALGSLGYSDLPRFLTLVSDPDGAAIQSERSFIFDANPAPVVVAAVEDVATVEDTETGTEEEVVAVETAETSDPVANAEAEQVAAVADTPAILSVSPDGVEVVQPAIAADSPPEVMSTVALDTITYDPEGEVVLRGRAVGDGFVQVYVDNAPISRLPVDDDGRWRGDLPDVDKGVYTLRIDEVSAEGDVVSRIETPFLREDPADVVQAMADEVDNPDFTIATRTVQPGMTLWAIAEERYGNGVLYVNVFEANKDSIRDPNMIFPGQVFTIPEAQN